MRASDKAREIREGLWSTNIHDIHAGTGCRPRIYYLTEIPGPGLYPRTEPPRNAPLARPRELLVPTGLPWQVDAGNRPWRRVLAGSSPAPLEIRLSGHGRRRGHAGRLAN